MHVHACVFCTFNVRELSLRSWTWQWSAEVPTSEGVAHASRCEVQIVRCVHCLCTCSWSGSQICEITIFFLMSAVQLTGQLQKVPARAWATAAFQGCTHTYAVCRLWSTLRAQIVKLPYETSTRDRLDAPRHELWWAVCITVPFDHWAYLFSLAVPAQPTDWGYMAARFGGVRKI